MKKEKLLRAMDLADEKFVEEASPERAKKVKASWKTRKREIFWRSVAACFTGLEVAAGCWLFIPFNTAPPSVAQYADSDYYEVIQKLNEYNYVEPTEKNNYEKYIEGIFDIALKGEMNGGADFAPGMDAEQDVPTEGIGDAGYVEITDNQEAGVIEADLIKRTNTHIFYLDEGILRAFTIAGEESKEVGYLELDEMSETKMNYVSQWEFYLSADGQTAIIVASCFTKQDGACIDLIAVDVSDPAKMEVSGRVSVNGGYMSSRLVGESVLLITEFKVNSNVDFGNEEEYIPQIETNGESQTVDADNIVAPETLTSSRYTVVWKLDQATLELTGSAAFLSYSDQIYVSQEHIFATRTFTERRDEKDGYTSRKSMTEISALSYAGAVMEPAGSIVIEGYVKDQYSLDEEDGILRVVTTTSVSRWKEYTGDGVDSSDILLEPSVGGTNANLYCIDLGTWEIVAEVLQFAPQGEVVQSVRFDGRLAYVCTSVQLSDPVFFFDLSDLSNITVKDTGTIEGFSSSLVNFGNGHLLGIGRGSSWDSVKIEVYEESADGVISVCAYELENAEYSTEYKSYYIDRANQFVGLGVYKYGENKYATNEYILLLFDGYNLVELVNVPLDGSLQDLRAVYIDGYLYLFGYKDFSVEKVV